MSQSERRRQSQSDAVDQTDDRRSGSGDRRHDETGSPAKPKAAGSVSFDDRGNAVWEMRVETPMRRQEDPTVDLLKCLDLDDLEIEEEESEEKPGESGFNPYSRS